MHQEINSTKVQTALKLAGNKNNYQKLLVFLLCLLWLQINFVMIGPTLTYINPTFNCKSTGDDIIKQVRACQIIQQCQVIQSFTLTGQLHLYCDREWIRVSVQSAYSIGSVIGLFFMNLLSDTKGRKISSLIALTSIIVGATLTIFAGKFNISFLLLVSQLFNGFGGYSLFVLSYVLISDPCEDEFRQKGFILMNAVWGLSGITMGLIYIYEVNWFSFLLYYSLIPTCFLLVIFKVFLLQSPYILLLNNKTQECLKVFEKMCVINRLQKNYTEIQKIILQNSFNKSQLQNKKQTNDFKHIWKQINKKKNIKVILLLGFVYAIGNITYFGVGYTLEDQGQNYGVNSIALGCTQILTFIILHYFIQRVPRTKGVALAYFITAAIGLFFLIPQVEHNKIVATGLIGLNRMFFMTAYALIAFLQTQSFTADIQSTAAGIVQIFSLVGVLLAPLVIQVSLNLKINPMVSIGVILLLAIWPNKFIPQTLGKNRNPLQKQDIQQKETSTNQDLNTSLISDVQK